MTRIKAQLLATGLCAAAALAACTNTRQDVSVATVARTLIDSKREQRQGAQKIDERLIQFQVRRAFSASDGPLALMRISKTGSVALLRVIETNGPYQTWSAWGSTERRSITTRRGVITATRGLGTDLMSSSVNDLLQMVTGQQDGIERQVLRHLDGENQIEETEAYCAFTPDERVSFTSGELKVQVTRVDVYCKTDDGSFNNYYLVTQGGRIVESHTWLGEGLGYFTLSQLR